MQVYSLRRKMAKTSKIIQTINDTFYEGSAFIIDDDKTLEVDSIPTGVSVIDEAVGIGGIPRGRITEVWGAEASGKTTLCYHTIAEAQRMKLGTAFIDVEHSIDPNRMKTIGIDTSKLVISQPNSAEEALEIVEMMIRSGDFGIICVDSVAALVPQAEVDRDMGESTIGLQARLMSQAMRKLASPTSKYNVALMFTNQTRSKIGGFGYGSPVTTSGGNALKFYASLRLKMQYTGQIKNSSGQRISGKYKMTVVKNKMATPFKEANFEINENGIDTTTGKIEQLIEAGVITKSGAFYKKDGEVLAQGIQALKKVLKEKPNILK